MSSTDYLEKAESKVLSEHRFLEEERESWRLEWSSVNQTVRINSQSKVHPLSKSPWQDPNHLTTTLASYVKLF